MLSKEQKRPINYSNYFVLTEILFIVLPIIALFIIEAAKGEYFALFDKSDISFCSVLFSGQLIIKLVSSLLKRRSNVHWQFVAFEIAAIIAVGLIPALLFYVFMQGSAVQEWIKWAQLFWFAGLIWVYFELGGYAQEVDDNENVTGDNS